MNDLPDELRRRSPNRITTLRQATSDLAGGTFAAMAMRNPSTDIYGVTKPRMRGLLHAWTLVPFIAAAAVLVLLSSGAVERTSVALYGLAIASMLGASAAYHRLNVSEKVRVWLRRIDHSTIGVAVAGTYTPIVAMVTEGTERAVLLTVMWIGATGGLVLTLAWPQGPRWLRSGLYLALGWTGIFVMPDLLREAGVAAFVLGAVGGLLYTVGAVIYATRRPNISPQVFGFHELFHAFVVAAVVVHFATVATVVGQTT